MWQTRFIARLPVIGVDLQIRSEPGPVLAIAVADFQVLKLVDSESWNTVLRAIRKLGANGVERTLKNPQGG